MQLRYESRRLATLALAFITVVASDARGVERPPSPARAADETRAVTTGPQAAASSSHTASDAHRWELVRASGDANAAVFVDPRGELVLRAVGEALGDSGYAVAVVRANEVLVEGAGGVVAGDARVALAPRQNLADVLAALAPPPPAAIERITLVDAEGRPVRPKTVAPRSTVR